MVEIIREFGARLFLAGQHLGAKHSLVFHKLPQPPQQAGVFGQFFGQNIARAL